MMLMTRAALEKLRTLIQEHPDDPIVRVAVRDLDETRLSFTPPSDYSHAPEVSPPPRSTASASPAGARAGPSAV